MTLDTHIVIGSPDVDHAEVYNLFRQLVLTPEQVPCEIKEEDGVVRIDNPPGIGAYAWLMTKRNQDRSPFVHTCDEWCDDVVGERTIYLSYKDEYYTRTITAEEVEDHDKYHAAHYGDNGKGYIVISIDTAYSFHEKHPQHPQLGTMSCTSFHALVLVQFGAWMEEHHPEVPWWWQNEYSGEWFEKLDGLGLEKFLGNEFDRSMWFECMVKPALANAIGEDMNIVWSGSDNEIPKEG